MTEFVVDASVAVKWFIFEKMSDRALSLVDSNIDLFAPDLLRIELGSALSRRARQGHMTLGQASDNLRSVDRYFDYLVPAFTVLDRAMVISLEIGHPFADCVYLATARAQNICVITADSKFVENVAYTPYAKDVIALADWKG